jgi:hypothetical protein
VSPSILGCAWLGVPLAAFFAATGYRVNGSTASPDKLPRLEARGSSPTRSISHKRRGGYPDLGTEVDETTQITAGDTPGLMGYDRIGVNYFRTKPVSAAGTPVNHVHRDDIILAIDRLIQTHCFDTYNLCAPLHPTKKRSMRTGPYDWIWIYRILKTVSLPIRS